MVVVGSTCIESAVARQFLVGFEGAITRCAPIE